MGYHDRLKSIVNQKKPRIRLKLPPFLKKIYHPMFLYYMRLQLIKDFCRKDIRPLLENNPLTLEAAINFSVSIYCLATKNRFSYRSLLENIKKTSFLEIIKEYGDGFGSQILRNVHEDVITQYDIDSLTNSKWHNIFSIYTNKTNTQIFLNIRKNCKNKDIDNCIIGSCNYLVSNPSLFNRYLAFYTKMQQKPELFSEVLETTSLIAKYLGTQKSFLNFIKLCEALENEALMPEVITTLKTLARYANPEIFEKTTSWACETSMGRNFVSLVFKHSHILLDDKSQSTYSIFSFGKFVNYVINKEEKFLRMEEKDLEYYVEKAVEFFVDA